MIEGPNIQIMSEYGDSCLNRGRVILRPSSILKKKSSVKVQNDLESQGQSSPFSKAALLIPRGIIGANLVILAETDGQTDGGDDTLWSQHQ